MPTKKNQTLPKHKEILGKIQYPLFIKYLQMVETEACLTQCTNICFKPTNTTIGKEIGKLYCL